MPCVRTLDKLIASCSGSGSHASQNGLESDSGVRPGGNIWFVGDKKEPLHETPEWKDMSNEKNTDCK